MKRNAPLRWLLQTVPQGCVLDSRWLSTHGVSRQSASAYVEAGWLVRLRHGLYLRPSPGFSGGQLPWQSAVASLSFMGGGQHVAAMWALHLHGHGHYLRMGRPVVDVGGSMPAWLKGKLFDADFRQVRDCFGGDRIGIGTRTWEGGLAYRMSSSERAGIEACHAASPGSCDEIAQVIPSLTVLHRKRVRELMLACRSVKAKRLFAALSDRGRWPWWQSVDLTDVDFGTGNRQFVVGGKTVRGITLPKPEPELGP